MKISHSAMPRNRRSRSSRPAAATGSDAARLNAGGDAGSGWSCFCPSTGDTPATGSATDVIGHRMKGWNLAVVMVGNSLHFWRRIRQKRLKKITRARSAKANFPVLRPVRALNEESLHYDSLHQENIHDP